MVRHRLRHTSIALTLLVTLFLAGRPGGLPRVGAQDDFTISPTSGPPGTVITITPGPSTTDTINAGKPVAPYFIDNCSGQNGGSTTTYTAGQDGTIPTMTLTIPANEPAPCTDISILIIVSLGNGSTAAYGPVSFQLTTGTASGTSPTPTTTGTSSTPTTTATVVTQYTLTPSTVALGQQVSFSAGGFQSGEIVSLTVQINGNTLSPTTNPATLIADSSGSVSGTFSLPVNSQAVVSNGSNGNAGYNAQVQLTGHNSGHQLVSTLTVPSTRIQAPTGSVAPGSSFTITGGGFQSNEPVSLTLIAGDGTSTVLSPTPTTQSDGTFSATVTAPSAAGSYTVKAVGQSSGLVATAQLAVNQSTTLTVSPVIATAGQNVTITGSGFTSNVSVTITGLSGGSAVAQTDGNGAFSTSLAVPANPSGPVITVTATDANQRSATAYVSIDNGQQPTITVSPTTATSNQAVTVTGTNFAAGEQVTLALAPANSPSSPISGTRQVVKVGPTRALNATYTVPTLVDGGYLLVATGQSSNRTATATLTVQGGSAASPTATSTVANVAFATETPISGPSPTATPAPPTATATALPASADTTFFAEGFTGQAAINGRATFRETLNLLNTTGTSTVVTVTYYVAIGGAGATRTKVKTVRLGAFAVGTLSVNADVGNDHLVSIAVGHAPGVVAQMLISRTSPTNAILDAAASPGSAQAATSWDFAEGYAGEQFQEYLSIFNPSSGPANVQVRFLPTSGAPPAPLVYPVPAGGRRSINVRAAYLGLAGPHAPKSIALIVSSDQKIVVDRVLYWGSGAGSGKFGYEIAPGIPAGSTQLSFPALVRTGANEPYITVLNPGPARAYLQIVFRSASGRVLVSYTNNVAPLARLTVPVRTILPSYSGVLSATLNATVPVVAESPLYLNGSPNQGRHPGIDILGYAGSTTGAIAGIGASDAILYVYNPGTGALQVTARLGTPGGAGGDTGINVPPLGIAVVSLPAGTSGSRGLLLSAGGPFTAAVINGAGGTTAAWGGVLLSPS